MYFFDKRQKLITKSEAFNSATYGKCMTREQYVMREQTEINVKIREKISNVSLSDTDFEKYFLILSFNETEEECSQETFKPFIDNGYEVEKLSDKISSLSGTHVYLLNWRKELEKSL